MECKAMLDGFTFLVLVSLEGTTLWVSGHVTFREAETGLRAEINHLFPDFLFLLSEEHL